MRYVFYPLLLSLLSLAWAEDKPTHFKSPQLLNKVAYQYPPKARDLEVEAVVYVKLSISAKGKVEKFKITQIKLSKPIDSKKLEKELKKGFRDSVRLSIKKARFKPARQKNQVVASSVLTAVNFVLK